MSLEEVKAWQGAARIAFYAMGYERVPEGRRMVKRWRAHDDPLAWWCLTEWIKSYRDGADG